MLASMVRVMTWHDGTLEVNQGVLIVTVILLVMFAFAISRDS